MLRIIKAFHGWPSRGYSDNAAIPALCVGDQNTMCIANLPAVIWY